jgi:hypothetical protein
MTTIGREFTMEIKVLEGFEHYLAIEHENLSNTIAMLEEGYQLVLDLDNLYNSCLNISLPSDLNIEIPAFLHLISHQEFYSGIAAFLRLHKTQSFRCLRAALDSTFTAYYLLKNPDKTEIYLDRGRNFSEWESLFRNIKATIKNNQNIFPLAVGLPEVYDLCSKFAHADPEGIFHKYFMDKRGKRLYAQYFDFEKTVGDYKRWFVFLLSHFFKIFLIYWNEMLRGHAGKRRKEIESLAKDYKVNINDFRKRYPLPPLVSY